MSVTSSNLTQNPRLSDFLCCPICLSSLQGTCRACYQSSVLQGILLLLLLSLCFFKFRENVKGEEAAVRKYLCCGPPGSGLGRKLVSTELPSLALTQGWGVRWTLLSEQQEGGRRKTKPTQRLETLQGREEWLYNLRGPLQNENAGPLFTRYQELQDRDRRALHQAQGPSSKVPCAPAQVTLLKPSLEGSACSRGEWAVWRAFCLSSMGLREKARSLRALQIPRR